MRLKNHHIFLFVASFACFFSLAAMATPTLQGIDDSWIRIRIYEKVKRLSLMGSNIEVVDQIEAFRNVAIAPVSEKKLNIELKRKWDRSLLFLQKDSGPVLVRERSVFIRGQGMRVNAQSITNFIQIYKRDASFDVIAYVKLREYLKGVVSSEMPVNWPAETLKAQIIAARSYAMFMAEQRKKLIFDVESSIKDQVYRHTEDDRMDPLLDDTANMVLFDGNRKLLKAYYHSECGGQTSSAKKVFGDSQMDFEVRDPYCQGRTWRLEIPKGEMEKYFGPFKTLVNAFDPIKRAYAVTIERSDSLTEAIDAQKLRMRVGSTRMKSTWFESRVRGDKVEFVGKGYGHGVGLCQWGSRQMGIMKKSFREILAFYYPGTKIVSLN
ncbi:MAG: SpoIID/LytB domain-containing protein [Bdellovibrionaceae bacterium]|nr:SpoIID/LytB domain-containing protein [Pseudobdellovibrionaceae bacterium]